jgi:hypothetical protein
MNKILLITAGLALTTSLTFGQTGDIYAGEAFKNSEILQTGTARFRGLGGNHAALGGDASNAFGNPAGLAFYNRSEISISPMMLLNNSSSAYIGNTVAANKTRPAITQFGLIFANDDSQNNSRWKRTAFGVTFSQQINYFNNLSFGGRNLNANSSFLQPFINDANNNNLLGSQIDKEYDSKANQATDLLAAAYQLYLVNGTEITSGTQQGDSKPPYFRYDASTPKDQTGTFDATGANSQWSIAYAGNLDDKLYVGANINFQRVRYTSDFVFTEAPVGGKVFNNYSQRDQLTVRGGGAIVTVGAIFKATPGIQLGATITTPSLFANYSETFNQSLRISVKDPKLPVNVDNVAVVPADFSYRISSPFRASGGATVFLGERKIGFITATAEYVGYAGMRASTTGYDAQGNTAFGNDVTTAVKSTYQNTINFRVGAEFRAGIVRVRGGLGYLSDPYKQKLDNIDRTRLLVSGGLGLRTQRYFMDLSGTFYTLKSAFTPYTLPSSRDYASAQTTGNNANIALSVGAFF